MYDNERIRELPALLATIFAALAVAALVHSLVSIVRSLRRDLAMLKTLGFVRHQVVISTGSMALAFAAVALAIGMPLGVVAGRSAWLLLGGGLGVSARPEVPLTFLAVLVPAVLVPACLSATAPGWLAARTRIDALRLP